MTPKQRKTTLLKIINDSLEQMRPESVVKKNISFEAQDGLLTIAGESVSLNDQKVWVTGVGKASVKMARAVTEILGNRIADGLIIAPDAPEIKIQTIQVLKGSHPIPDKESLSSTYELLHFVQSIPDEAPVICLLSGGASALLCMPEEGLEINEVGQLHKLLLDSGMDIHQMNTIRKCVSKVKAGGLLRALSHTQLFDLVISDVPGDQLSSIGSGPTTFEQKKYDDAFKLMKQFGIWNLSPHSIRTHIARGMHENISHVPPVPFRHHSKIVSSAEMLAETVATEAKRRDLNAYVDHPAYNNPIEEVEKKILERIQSAYEKKTQPSSNESNLSAVTGENGHPQYRCLIFYGESSVNVTGGGKGGRNQELALRIARHLSPEHTVSLASVGTDGIDGPTDAAGAVVDETTTVRAIEKGLDPNDYLQKNDSYTFFEKAGGHIKMGPTGNNLMDLQIILMPENDNHEL